MGRIYSSCGELENWLRELLDCCSFSSYSPAKSLWEGFAGKFGWWNVPAVARSIWGQRELPRQSRSQSSVCSMSSKYWLFVEKTHQPCVWNRGVLVFSTKDSSATAPGAETAGTEMGPMGTFSITKLKYFWCCSVYKLSCSSCGTSSRMSFLCCPEVRQRSCVMQRGSSSVGVVGAQFSTCSLYVTDMLERRGLEILRERSSQVSWFFFFQH